MFVNQRREEMSRSVVIVWVCEESVSLSHKGCVCVCAPMCMCVYVRARIRVC